MAGRERRSMMTGAQAAHCGSVSAISLGLPVSTAIPEAKGTLPKALFVGKAPISGKLKQRLVNEIESITMLALARSANTGLADGKLIPEVLVIGLKLTAKATGIPNEVIDLIAGQRKSGIVFVCVRDVPFEGSTREECAFAVRRAIPGRAGHTPIYQVYAGDWQPAGEAQLELAGSTIDELWASLCSQTILGTPEVENLDARIIRHTEIARLESEVDKLTRDHQRVKNPALSSLLPRTRLACESTACQRRREIHPVKWAAKRGAGTCSRRRELTREARLRVVQVRGLGLRPS